MATSRAQAPPVNLKERIAALQQRNVSPGPRPTSPSAPSAPIPNSAGLRDKIAKFERKGGVPVPRGSFGLGAPPLAENGPAKRRGELYGNRIPGTVRVSGGGPSVSRSNSPFDSTRSFSTPTLYGEDHDTDPTNYASSPTSPPSPGSSFPGLTPQHTGTRDPPVRGTRFSTALELARRAEGNFEASLKPAERESSSSPGTVLEEQAEGKDEQGVVLTQSSSPSPPKSQPEAPAHTEASAIEASPLPSPPEIVLSPSGDLEEEQVVSEATILSECAPEESAISTEPSVPSNALQTGTGSALNNSGSKVVALEVPAPDEPTSSTQEACDPSQVVETTIDGPAKIVPDAVQHDVPSILSSSSNEVKPVPQQAESAAQRETEVPPPVSNDQSPLSPMGPFTLANAVHDLGQVVANIHDMFPGQISPLAAPPPFRPFTVETPAQEQSQELKTPLKSEASVPDLRIPLPTEAVPIPQSTSLRPEASSNLALPVAEQAKHLTTPRTATSRPVSMIETSPSHVVIAHRVTPLTSRGVPVFLSANANRQQGQQNFEHFPPTPEPNEAEFGTVSLHKPSHSFSHARTFVAHGQTADQDSASQAPKFSAVVHAKVTEQPSAPSSSYKDFYAKVPETPQINRTRSSTIPETPMSPGYGELATLLHEAALLELTLEQGDLPSEAVRREDSERQQKEQEEKARQKEAAARAKVEEERRKHATVAKARAKQEATESKSKSSFRNPLLRSKTSHKRDVSMDSVASKDPARSKSTLLPFRPQQQSGGPPGSTPVASIPEKEIAPETDDADAASQTSPKSPRQYFAGLRRLTSTSRPSIGSGSQYRNSVSASSEMSSEDSASIPTPPGNGMYSAGSNGSTVESGNTGIWNGSGIAWPSLSPKKSPSMGRAASFADKMWNRGRTKSTISTHSAYDTIERLTKSAAAKSAAALIPPLDPVSFALDVPTLRENDLPSPPEELVSPRRSASLYVASTSQFPPVYPAKPTSPVYTLQPMSGMPQPVGLDALLSEKLTSPVYTPHPGQAAQGMQNLDTLFSAKPTSPVYTPHLPAMAMRSQETITDSLLTPHHKAAESLLPSPRAHNSRRSSWVSDLSMDSSTSSIPSPFFDSFPSVPEEMPMPPALSGRQRSFNRPSLPLPTPSFFEPAPLSSTTVGAEFFSAPSPFAKSATLPRISGGEHHR